MAHYSDFAIKSYDEDLSKTWYVEYYWWNTTSSGYGKKNRVRKYIRRSIKTVKERYARANQIIAEEKEKLNRGIPADAKDLELYGSLEFVIRSIAEYRIGQVDRERTVEQYRAHVNQFLEWARSRRFSNLYIEDFTFHHAGLFLNWVEQRKNRKGEIIGPKTYNTYLQNIGTLFTTLLKRGIIKANPFFPYSKKKEHEVYKTFSDHNADLAIATLKEKNEGMYMIALMVYYLLMRPVEITRLQFSSIDLSRNLLFVEGEISKGKRTYNIDIPDPLAAVYRQMRVWDYPQDWHLVSTKLKPGPVKIHRNRVTDQWKWIVKDGLGIQSDLYTLKNKGIFNLIQAGYSIVEVQRHARHASIKETQKYFDAFEGTLSSSMKQNYPAIGTSEVPKTSRLKVVRNEPKLTNEKKSIVLSED